METPINVLPLRDLQGDIDDRNHDKVLFVFFTSFGTFKGTVISKGKASFDKEGYVEIIDIVFTRYCNAEHPTKISKMKLFGNAIIGYSIKDK